MTLNKYQLALKIREKVHCRTIDARGIIDIFSEIILEEVLQGNKINFGKLGVFSLIEKKARRGIHPQTLEMMEYGPKTSIKFSTYPRLKKELSKK